MTTDSLWNQGSLQDYLDDHGILILDFFGILQELDGHRILILETTEFFWNFSRMTNIPIRKLDDDRILMNDRRVWPIFYSDQKIRLNFMKF
jgi:hypothetical protein